MKQKKVKAGFCPEGVDLLLPWYLNGTLEKEEKAAVKKHLRHCSICQEELAAIKKEQKGYQAIAEEIPVPQIFPHLMAEIEKRERTIWQRVASLIPRPQPALLIVTQLIVIAGLIGLFTLNPWGAGERFYRTLSGPQAVEGTGPKVSILFQDGVQEKTAREVILEINGTIVRGPSPMGIYTVELQSDMSAEELQGIISSLRQKRDVIRFVEVQGE
ncbi:MAG: zf-HC2 domain-containing protein [Deltaproteobacteria bacterium]|nr:zf-HC2 domain-containing protein [Deltaproteobacteria bacterium]